MNRIAKGFFWISMWVMLGLGIVSTILSEGVLKGDTPSWTGIGVWAGTFGLCALLLGLISNAAELLRALAAMWRPLTVVLAAAYLLFANDQGRELGGGLMVEDHGWRPFLLLFLALIYWAANNWHTARLGLRAAVERNEIPKPSGDENWLFWPPRLLGVCAHLFAAVNLSLAAEDQPAFASGGSWLVAWTAP